MKAAAEALWRTLWQGEQIIAKAGVVLRGTFTPIVTPFDEYGKVADDKLEFNLGEWNRTGLSGYIVLGSNGENVYLNEREKAEVLKRARQLIPEEKLLIGGTGCESMINTVALTEEAAALGADAAILVNPSYYKGQMTEPVLVNHYRVIADSSPVSIVIYNLPPATGIDLSADVLVELSQHPSIIGVRDTSGNMPKMGKTIRRADPSF